MRDNKGANQPAHLRSLVSVFVICALERTMAKLATCNMYITWLVSGEDQIEPYMVAIAEHSFSRDEVRKYSMPESSIPILATGGH